jgi:hypothetical protein
MKIQLGNMFLMLKYVWGKRVFSLWFVVKISSHIWRGTSPKLGATFFFKIKFSSHVSSTYLLEGSQDVFCIFFVELPQAWLCEDVVDVHGGQGGHLLEYVDQPFERHMVHHGDLVWSKDSLSLSYCSPIQEWIEKSCESAYQLWHIFDSYP